MLPKLLKPLNWTKPNNDNDNDILGAPSPTHDYIVEAVGNRFDVRYHNRFTTESDRNPDFKTLEAAQSWVQDKHAEEKIREWCLPFVPGPLERCAEWFTTANPEPVLENVVVQQGVHCEEVAEMFDSMGENKLAAEVRKVAKRYKAADSEAMVEMAHILNTEVRLDEYVDSLIDQIVTLTGDLSNMGVDGPALLARVNASNFSKFVEGKPVRLTPNGKIQKGPDYFKPELSKHIKLSGDKLLEELSEYNDEYLGDWIPQDER